MRTMIQRFARELLGTYLLLCQWNPIYPEKDCHRNAERMAEENGGSAVVGWAFDISKTYPVCFANWHSVWQDNNGNYFDITKQSDLALRSTNRCGEDGKLFFLVSQNQATFPELYRAWALTKNKEMAKRVRLLNQRAWECHKLERKLEARRIAMGLPATNIPITDEEYAYREALKESLNHI
jgi:hypothetical protein